MGIYSRVIDAQNLRHAWEKVLRNKPASGADSVTYADFDNNLKAEISQLQCELQNHTYKVFPVKLVKLHKENKIREIALYSMRDKTVQVSLGNVLTDIYEDTFTERTYAYRQNKSGLQAIEDIEEAIKNRNYVFALKTDVQDFFEHIQHERLRVMLEKKIKEQDILDLIMQFLQADYVGEDGELHPKQIGIYQGASISPILSNIYMDELDRQMVYGGVFFARYADDMILLAENVIDLQNALIKLQGILENVGLTLNEKKTFIKTIEEGFTFLGYDFDSNGKAIPAKAKERLENNLEDVWLTMPGTLLEDRLKKGSQILNGWEQYYRGSRKAENIYEYVVLVYMMRYKKELVEWKQYRWEFNNSFKDIAIYLISVWREHEWKDLMLLEYEQYFEIGNGNDIQDQLFLDEILQAYDKLIIAENVDSYSVLMQSYADCGLFNTAEKIQNKIQALQQSETIVVGKSNQNEETAEFYFDNSTLDLMQDLFCGREDRYVTEFLDENQRRKVEHRLEPLDKELIRRHLKGDETIGTYPIRPNRTVQYILIDIDISKKYILEVEKNDSLFQEYLQHAADITLNLKKMLKNMGLNAYVEYSGFRGYHLWAFFQDWISIRYVYALIEIVRQKVDTQSEDITIEFIPDKNKKNDRQSIKFPYGIHSYSGMRSYFCNDDFSPIYDINTVLLHVSKYDAALIKKIIGANSFIEQSKRADISIKEKIELDYTGFENMTESIRIVLEGCILMKYLVHKAVSTGYLGHFERVSILAVFGHMGEEGKEFVHDVMRYTINYQYNVTQGFIDRILEKPISCNKLREQYKQITAEYGCSCRFKRTRNCYPSPVIHALKNNDEENHDITIPVSRYVSKEKQETVYDDLNIHSRAEELAAKLIELKKQERGIQKAIKKTEKELSILFNNAAINSLDIDMGILIRKETEDGWDWVIDI